MGFLETIQSDYLVLLIPIISAFVGWFTNVLAVKMMFYPTEFIGIPPYLGWQGIIPASAEKLARFSTKLITTKLLSLEQLFENFKGEAFASEMDAVVEDITNQIIAEVAEKRAKVMWENAGEVMQNMVRENIRTEVRAVVIKITDDFSGRITEILDLEQVVLDAVLENRSLMSMMFLEVGKAEFEFIFDVTAMNEAGKLDAFGAGFVNAVRADPRLQDPLTLGSITQQFIFAPGACDAIQPAMQVAGASVGSDDGCSEAVMQALIAFARSAGASGVDARAREAAAAQLAQLDAAAK